MENFTISDNIVSDLDRKILNELSWVPDDVLNQKYDVRWNFRIVNICWQQMKESDSIVVEESRQKCSSKANYNTSLKYLIT